ncbi:hypothetical protein MRX96_006530 [Rhipicephalus microplus]
MRRGSRSSVLIGQPARCVPSSGTSLAAKQRSSRNEVLAPCGIGRTNGVGSARWRTPGDTNPFVGFLGKYFFVGPLHSAPRRPPTFEQLW